MVKRFTAHSQPVTSIVYESSGEYFATSAERQFSVWEEDYESSLFDLEFSDDEVSSLCFLDCSGALHLLVGTSTGEVLTVDLLRKSYINSVSAGVDSLAHLVASRDDAVSHTPVEIIAAARDGRAFAVFAGAGHWLLKMPDNTGVTRIMDRSRVCGMRFSSDGDQLRIGFSDGRIETRDTSTVENVEIVHVAATRSDFFLAMVFNQDASLFASRCGLRLVQIWDTLTGEELVRVRDMEAEPTILKFSPDGRFISCAFPDGAIRLWDTLHGEMLHSLPVHNKEVRDLLFPGIPDHLLVHYSDGALRLWNFREGSVVNCWCNDCENVSLVSMDTDGIQVAVAMHDSILVGNFLSATHETKLPRDSAERTVEIQWMQGTPFLVTWGLETEDILVWNLTRRALHAQLVGHSGQIKDCLALSEVGQMATASADGTIRQWDLCRSAPQRALVGPSQIRVISMSHDGSEVAVGHADGKIYRWDVKCGKVESVLSGHESPVLALAYCRSRSLLVSGSRDWTVRQWDLTQNEEICCFRGHQGKVLAVACADDGRRFASTSVRESIIRVWDPLDPNESVMLEGHRGEIMTLAISRDGELLASGSEDRTIRIWNLDDGQEIACFDSVDPRTTAIAFAADGKRIIAIYDRRTRIFDLMTGRCVETIEGHSQIHAVAEGWPLVAKQSRHSIAILSQSGGGQAAILPATDYETNLATHEAGQNWAGVMLDKLVLLQLEGGTGSHHGQPGGFTV